MDGHDTSADKDSGNSTASGAQGIFSTPDLTIDANNISPNYDSERSRSRVASIFANTDAGQRSQKLNNAMGISSQPVQLSQPVTEDVVINNTPRKRSKVPFIILGLLALIILGGIVSWIIANISNGQAYNRVKTAFYEYANLMMDGEASKKKPDATCLENGNCYLLQAIREKESWNSFVAKATTAKDKLSETLNAWAKILETENSNDQDYDTLAQEIQNLISLQNFIDIYFSRDMLRKIDIVKYYLQNGDSGLRDYFTDYYGSSDDNNEYLHNLRTSVAAMGDATMENIDIYARYGCMSEIMNVACFTTSEATEDERAIVANNDQIIANYGSEMGAYTNAPYILISDIIETNDSFNTLTEQK